ncbi:MAG: site-2 protease family protein [Tenericutes bacterium]|nr:site-2 protease family protein [Mycoplasmatota bacterium]
MKKRGWLYFLILAFFIGYSYTALVYNGIWFKFTDGLKTIHFLLYFVWFFLAFFVSLTIHELGHFFAFLFQGIKLRALYITIFVFYKTDQGWRFTIKPKLWVLLGGLVVPDLGAIQSEEDLKDTHQKFAKALLAAPIVTCVFLFLVILTFFLSIIFSTNDAWNGFISIFTIYTTLLSALYIYSFTLSNPMFYGDFVAYKKMKEDPIFQLAQITQYTMFSSDDSDETTEFLWEKARSTLTTVPFRNSIFHTMVLTNYLDGVIRLDKDADPQIDKKLKHLQIAAYTRSEQGLMLAYDLCYYYYKQKNVEKAYQLYEEIQKRVSKKLDPKLRSYYQKKSMHVMHIEYQDEFLDNKDNYYIGNSWIFEALMDPYETLKEYHEKLPFVEYSVPVKFEEEAILTNTSI